MRFELSTANSSEFVGRTLVIHVGTASDPTSDDKRDDSTEAISIQPLGLVSRPVSPEKGAAGEVVEAAGCLLGREGGRVFAMPTTDPRTLTRLPLVGEGETAIYAPAGASVFFMGADGSIQAIAVYDESSSHGLALDVTGDQVQIRHRAGHMVHMDDEAISLMHKQGASARLEADGWKVNGDIIASGNVISGAGLAPTPALPVSFAPGVSATTMWAR